MAGEGTHAEWLKRNQAFLALHLDVIEARLAWASAKDDGRDAAEDRLRAAQRALDGEAEFRPRSALGRLAQGFGLTPFECDLLMLTAGVELKPAIAELVARLRGHPDSGEASFAVALACLGDPHWNAISPGRPLRYWHCLRLEGPSSTRSSLLIDERMLACLLGLDDLDRRLLDRSRALPAAGALPPSHAREAQAIARGWASTGDRIFALNGRHPEDRRRVAARTAEQAGLICHLIRASDLPEEPGERVLLQRLWERESVIRPLCLLVEIGEHESDTGARRALDFIEECTCRIIVSTRNRIGGGGIAWRNVASPTPEEQERLWKGSFGPAASAVDADLSRVLGQFDLGAADIERIGHAIRNEAAGDTLWQRCRALAEPRLAALADRIEPSADWADLVLPPREQEVLRQIAAQVRNRFTVYQRWGMAPAGSRGRGVTALFAGPSGTGKTLAAEVLADDLELDLYRIDLSAVVSKYIGETEKNLNRIFDAAEGGGVVLLFDEADALFGERSQVSDSHDRYANIEIAYLLQRMEQFSGLSILTTNIRDAIDQGFLRRLRFLVDFPFPDRALRRAIWERSFPRQIEACGLDMERLSQLNVAGGTIRNIALNAAFIAADQSRPVAMEHLLRAARYEYAKMDRPLSPAETEGWA